MKKFLVIFALAGILVSCKDKKKEEPKSETPTTTNTTDAPATDPAPVTNTGGAPSFNDADVNAYVQAYEDYVSSYKKAVDGKDMSKMADLAKMGQDLATKGTAAAQKLAATPEDAKKLAEYMTAKGNEIMELSKKLTGQ